MSTARSGFMGTHVTDRVEATPLRDNQRNRALFFAAWAGFAALVMALGAISLNACSMTWLQGWTAPLCEVGIPPPRNVRAEVLALEIKKLERQLADVDKCPMEEAQAEPCPDISPAEVALSVDVSPSMGYCLDTPFESERRLDALWRQMENANPLQLISLQAQYNALQNSMQCRAPNRRIDAAKAALTNFTAGAKSDTTFLLQSFSYCRPPQNHGRYSQSARGDMENRIQGLQLGESTSLAQALIGAAAALEGGRTADKPANIVIVSDGQDSCGGDACAAARQIKQSHPFTTVHVITVGGDISVGRCIADATGGKVFEARDASNLASAIAEASGESLPEHCRGRK